MLSDSQGRLQDRRPLSIIDIGSNSIRLVVYEGLARSPTMHHYEMSADSATNFLKQVAKAEIEKVKGIEGVSKNRRSLLPYGAIVLQEIMIEEPGSFSGSDNSPRPERGPEPRKRMSLAILKSAAAAALMAPCENTMLLMPFLAARIAVIAPRVSFRFLDSARGDVSRLLQDDEIDAALERPLEVSDWVSSTPLFHSPFAVIAADDNAAIRQAGIAEGEPLPIQLFCELPHVLRSIDGSMSGSTDEALRKIGRTRRVSLALPHFQAVALAVANGNYLAAVPRQFAVWAAKTLPLVIFEPPLPIAVPEVRMYWHARHDDEPPHRWVRNQILEAIEALGFLESVATEIVGA